MNKPKLISKQSIETVDSTPWVLSKAMDHAFETMFRELKSDMRENTGCTYMLTITSEKNGVSK